VIALDARIRVAPSSQSAAPRLAIRPYPAELEQSVQFLGRNVRLRPIRPEDAPQHREFLSRVAPEDLRARFFATMSTLPEAEILRLTQIDYERAMAFIAEAPLPRGGHETLGVARAHSDSDNVAAEFGVLVRSDLKGKGLGTLLLDKLIRYCRARGIARLEGDVLADNTAMLQVAAASGFVRQAAQRGVVHVSLKLASRIVD
jgi:acetyltransferase